MTDTTHEPPHLAERMVLLIGGSSGTGKTIAAREIGLRLGIPWLQVDDLRLAFQYSQVTLPERTDDLYYFLRTEHVWRQTPERLRDALIAVGELMSPAIEIVVAHHVDLAAPIVIEGDGIIPSLFDRPLVRERAANGLAQAVFLVEPDEDALLANMLARGRGIEGQHQDEQCIQARMSWLYGQWLTEEASRYGLPVVEPRPWATLVERVVAAFHDST